jgi:hypothetical protein
LNGILSLQAISPIVITALTSQNNPTPHRMKALLEAVHAGVIFSLRRPVAMAIRQTHMMLQPYTALAMI